MSGELTGLELLGRVKRDGGGAERKRRVAVASAR